MVVAQLVHRFHFFELHETLGDFPFLQRTHRRKIVVALLPLDGAQFGAGQGRVRLQNAQSVARFDGMVLAGVADQEHTKIMFFGGAEKGEHLAQGNLPGFVQNQHATGERGGIFQHLMQRAGPQKSL